MQGSEVKLDTNNDESPHLHIATQERDLLPTATSTNPQCVSGLTFVASLESEVL